MREAVPKRRRERSEVKRSLTADRAARALTPRGRNRAMQACLARGLLRARRSCSQWEAIGSRARLVSSWTISSVRGQLRCTIVTAGGRFVGLRHPPRLRKKGDSIAPHRGPVSACDRDCQTALCVALGASSRFGRVGVDDPGPLGVKADRVAVKRRSLWGSDSRSIAAARIASAVRWPTLEFQAQMSARC
jgi:hypothetical protein